MFDTTAAFARARQLIEGERVVGDPATIHFLTGTEAVVPAQAVTDTRAARVAVDPLGLTGASPEAKQARRALERKRAGGPTVGLAQLASDTGGSYNSAKNGAGDAAKDATKAVKEAHSDPYAGIAFGVSEPLKAGAAFDTPFRVATLATDGEIAATPYFDPRDAAVLTFALVAPDGKVCPSTALPADISFNLSGPDGTAEFSIAGNFPQRAGLWKLRVGATAPTTDWVAADVAGFQFRVALSVQVNGGASGLPPVLTAVLGGDQRIKGAAVTAVLFDEEGNVVIDGLTLKDDGVAPDQRAGDGQYTASLAGKLKAGEYFALVAAETNDGSRTASLGALVKGTRSEELPVDRFERITEADFALEANAPGVLAATVTPGDAACHARRACRVLWRWLHGQPTGQ